MVIAYGFSQNSAKVKTPLKQKTDANSDNNNDNNNPNECKNGIHAMASKYTFYFLIY